MIKVNIHDYVYKRVLDVAEYTIKTKSDIRRTAKIFGVSKSTIHKDLRERLPKINPQMSQEIEFIFQDNKYLGQLLGADTTARRYRKFRN